MANADIVKFPKAKRAIPANLVPDVTRRYRSRGRGRDQILPWNIFFNVVIFILECLRTIVLTLLLWFRPLLFLVCRPLSGLMLIAFIICLFSHPHDHRLTYGFGIFSFSAFLIMHLYDSFLVFLSRGNIVNIFN